MIRAPRQVPVPLVPIKLDKIKNLRIAVRSSIFDSLRFVALIGKIHL